MGLVFSVFLVYSSFSDSNYIGFHVPVSDRGAPMADETSQAVQSSDDKVDEQTTEEKKYGIEFYKGNTNILLIAPHGVESDPLEDLPLDDIGTAELTRQIRTHLGCSSVINPTYRKPKGNKPAKRNHGKPSIEKKVLNLNIVVQATKLPYFLNKIRQVVNKGGLTYVFWIHGIADERIAKGTDCLIGCGQPNVGENARSTAKEETIKNLMKQFQGNGIRAVKAPMDSKYRGWKTSYMNQWCRFRAYNFDKTQSIQLEFRKTGIRGKDDIKSASKKIADAISALIEPGKTEAIPNVDESSDETKAPTDVQPEKVTDPAEAEGPIDEKGQAYSQPAEKDAATETGIESATEEEIPAQDTALTQKITETDDREDAIDMDEKASKNLNDEKAMVEVIAEVEVVDENPLVDEAYSILFGIFSRHYENAMMEAGFYIIKTFYGDSIKNARDNEPTHEQTLNQLYEKIEENKNPNSASRSKLYHAKNLIVQEDDLCMCLDKNSFSTFRNLSLSHKIYLLSVKGIEEKKKLIERVSTQQLSVRQLQAEIKKSRSNDPSPLQLINNPEKIWKGQNIEFISFDRLKKRSPMELKKYQKALALEKGTYEKYLKKFTDIEADLERAIEYSQTKSKRTPQIISVSRRTDIPALYSDWFFNRIKEGSVQVRKTVGAKPKIISLTPEDVRCFVFWTKNPGPMIGRLDELKDYHYYFHFTLTPYKNDLEKKLPPKDKLVETFIQLSKKKIGQEKVKVIWRYDPILLNDEIDIEYHKREFEKLAKSLEGHTDRCVINFAKISKADRKTLKLKPIAKKIKGEIAKELYLLGKKYGIEIETCRNKVDVPGMKINPTKCIDAELIGTIIGVKLDTGTDPSQRSKACGCAESLDIGTDTTCTHGCVFCYATEDHAQAIVNKKNHDKNAPLLIGNLE